MPRNKWIWAMIAAVVMAAMWFTLRRHSTDTVNKKIPDRSLISPLNLPGGGLAPGDAYEVYSALYQVPAGEPLVFSEDSVTDIPQVNGSCLKPSTPGEHELTEAFEAANRQSKRWEKNFTIPQGYQLIPRQQAAEAQTCIQTHGQDKSRCESYKQLRHVRFLGIPGFDRAHTRALVSIVIMCGRYCGNGGVFEVEKTGNTWRRAEATDFTRGCSWMY